MYDYIKGTLVKITAKYIVIEQTARYIVTVANPYSFSDQMNQTIQYYLHQVLETMPIFFLVSILKMKKRSSLSLFQFLE